MHSPLRSRRLKRTEELCGKSRRSRGASPEHAFVVLESFALKEFSMLHSCRFLFVLPLVAVLLNGRMSAQSDCYLPDNLDGSCCSAAAFPMVPQFSLPEEIPALGLCFDHCAEPQTHNVRIDFGETFYGGCDSFTALMIVLEGAFSPTQLLIGNLTADYSRTWSEFGPGGKILVWRYIVRVDLGVPQALDPTPCIVPACITPGEIETDAFFYGYLDFAVCLDAVPQEEPIVVLMLYHNTDYFIHMASVSSNPGVYHPAQSYAIVAHSVPLIAQNNFVAASNVVPEATAPNYHPVYGAMRDFGYMNHCYAPSYILPLTAILKIISTGCSGGFKTLREFSTDNTLCNSAAWHSLTYGFPSLPWYHMVSTSIGRWTASSVYPGNQNVWADEGLFSHQEECGSKLLEVKYGATTENTVNGYEMVEPIEGLRAFTDLVDNYTAPWLGPYPPILVGFVMSSDHVIYVSPK